MTTEEYQWHIKIVKGRFEYLNLSFEQAEKIFKYEQDKDTYSDSHFFSVWEEFDYEYSVFREILNEKQFMKYRIAQKENINRYEQSLIEEDNRLANQFNSHIELLDFYETKFLPDFFRDPFLIHFGPITGDYAKVVYVKAEYKRFLNDSKKKMLTNHFRHSRIFKPNELKISLMQHKLSCIFPDYASFKGQVDQPTKAMLDYLITRFRYLPEKTVTFLAGKFNQLKEFNKANFKKHFGDDLGWHFEMPKPRPEEEIEHQFMTLMLLDKDRYGF
jgi:hypothetical protein